ncbi:hypothetical protein ACQUSW_11400 [Microbacterium sp. YY-01]
MDVPAREIHGIEIDDELIWLADPGNKECPDGQGSYSTQEGENGGQVLAIRRDGTTAVRIGAPSLPIYDSNVFRPTSVVAAEDLWVADGYGANLVHRYNRSGDLLGSIGLEGVEFDNPHSIAWDDRDGRNELLVADRGNNRILAIEPTTGKVNRVIGDGVVERPSGMAIWRNLLVVADLNGRISLLNSEDELLTHLGESGVDALDRDGWPNVIQGGLTLRPSVDPGKFNAPHDVAVTPDGLLVVCEWMIGGRLTAVDLPIILSVLSAPAG